MPLSAADTVAPSLDTLIQRFDQSREQRTPLTQLFRDALVRLGFSPADLGEWESLSGGEIATAPNLVRLYRTGLDVAARVEQDRGPAYHNRDHAGESMLAAEALVLAQFTDSHDRMLQGMRLLVAMLGHDAGHPGSAPGTGEPGALERASAMIVQDCMAAYDSREKSVERNLQHDIIDGTEFGDGPARNWANHLAFPERTLYTLQVLANDADILASVLPQVGMQRGQLLAEEWRQAGSPAGDVVGTWAGRLGFLNAVAVRSEGAHRLGVPALQAAEIRVLETLDLDALQQQPLDEAIRTVLVATYAERDKVPAVATGKARRPR